MELILSPLGGADRYVMGAAEPGVLSPLEHVGDHVLGVVFVDHRVPLERQRAGVVALGDGFDSRRVDRLGVDEHRHGATPLALVAKVVVGPHSQLVLSLVERLGVRIAPHEPDVDEFGLVKQHVVACEVVIGRLLARVGPCPRGGPIRRRSHHGKARRDVRRCDVHFHFAVRDVVVALVPQPVVGPDFEAVGSRLGERRFARACVADVVPIIGRVAVHAHVVPNRAFGSRPAPPLRRLIGRRRRLKGQRRSRGRRYVVDSRHYRRPSALLGLRRSCGSVHRGDRLHPEPVLALALVQVCEVELILSPLGSADRYVMRAAEPGVLGPLEHVGDGVVAVRHRVPLERQGAGVVALGDGFDSRRVDRLGVDNHFAERKTATLIARLVHRHDSQHVRPVRQVELRHERRYRRGHLNGLAVVQGKHAVGYA